MVFKGVKKKASALNLPVNLRRDILRSLSGMAGARMIGLMLTFVSSVLLARYLGPVSYGDYVFNISLVSALALASYLGVPTFLTREIIKYNQLRKWGEIRGLMRKSYEIITSISIFLVLAVVLARLSFPDLLADDWDLLFISLPLLPILAQENLRVGVLRGFGKVVLGVFPEMIIRPVVFLVMLLALIYIEKVSVEIVVLVQVLAALAALMVGFILVRREVPTEVKKAALVYDNKKWFVTLMPFIGMAGAGFFNVEFINIFLGMHGTSQDVAMFRIAASLALFVALPLMLIESVLPPYITRLYHAGELGALEKLIKVVSLISLVLSAIPAAALLLFGSEIIKLFYGGDYVPAYSVLVVIVLGYMVVSFIGLSMQLLYATEYHAPAFRIGMYGAIITVSMCGFLIPLFGVLGAGIALGLGKALRSVLFVIEARRHLEIKTSLIW